MTIQDVLSYIADIKPHTISDDVLVRWLSDLEGRIYEEIVRWHDGGADIPHGPYDASTDMQTTLIAEAPYDNVYPLYLMAQIDFANGEYGRFNNSMAMYNSAFSDFANAYNRHHIPTQPKTEVY